MSEVDYKNGEDLDIDENTVKVVQLDGLVLLKLITQSKQRLPNYVTGQLLGLEVDGVLEVTNCFATPDATDDEATENYQNQMMQMLRKINVDYNTVGWFFSSFMGTFFTADFLEAQYSYQLNIPSSVCVVYDPYRTTSGRLFIRAFRLTDRFMKLYSKGKFSQEDFAKFDVETTDILEEIQIKVHNSHLVHGFLYELRELKTMSTDFDRLTSNANPFVEKSVDILANNIEDYAMDQNRFQFHQRSQARLKQQQQAYLNKVEQENESRKIKGMKPLPKEDLSKNPLFKDSSGFNKLDNYLISNQIAHYAQAITEDASQGLEKMYVIEALRAKGN